jgi:phosphoribosylformimino-5-aminoimidazole carboxamide ribotide isomerase
MFRPCIDLHEGKVKQVVGATLDQAPGQLRTNFISQHDAAWYANLYKDHGLKGGHVIMLGPGNDAEARSALQSFPGGLQVGGGIHPDNARRWLDDGASHVVVTSWVFSGGSLDWARLAQLVKAVGRERLVLDLSCRRRGADYVVMMNRWQTFTDLVLEPALFEKLAGQCSEFLIHAVDVEGLCRGMDEELIARIAGESPIPATYAGGARSLEDFQTVERLGRGRVDLTIGSALDIFGGTGVRFEDVVALNRELSKK